MRATIELPDPLEHVFAQDATGRPASCACGYEGDLLQHASDTLPHRAD